MVAKLLSLFPPHRIYVEPFGGGASLLFAKPPSPVEVYNDADSGLVNLFRVLRDPDKFVELQRLIELTPYSREEYKYCQATWQDCADEVERAHRFYVVARQSMSGWVGMSWSLSVTASNRGMAKSCSAWLSAIDRLPQIHQRLMQVQIEHGDFRRIFSTYDTLDTLFYCDPPYISSTRRSGGYACEMGDNDHRDLVSILLHIAGKAVLSGYDHPIYEPLTENGWRRLEFKTACHAAVCSRNSGLRGPGAALARQPRTEVVWISPSAVVADALIHAS